MSVLEFIALALLILTTLLIGALLWYLGSLPGRIAKERRHPYEQAIAVGGWATLTLGGIGWPFVLMWAYASLPQGISSTQPTSPDGELGKEIDSLKTQVESLSQQVRAQGGTK